MAVKIIEIKDDKIRFSKRALEKEHKKRFKELQKIRTARSSALAQGLLDKKDIKDIQRIFDENERELKTKIEQISTQMSENEESKKWVDWVNKFGEKIDTLKSTELSLSEKKQFLEGVLDKIMVKTVDHDKHQFHLQFKLPYVNDDLDADDFMKKMEAKGILLISMGEGKIRIVTHLDYTDTMHKHLLEVLYN